MRWMAWNNPSGTPLLLLHGFLGEAADWAQIASLLPEFYCIAPDLPGHGLSPITDDMTCESTISEIIRYLESRMTTPIGIVGYSMGGRLGIQLAVQHPMMVRSLSLESASLGIDNPVERRARIRFERQLLDRLQTMDPIHFLREWYSMPMFGDLSRHPRFLELLARRASYSPQSLARALTMFSAVDQNPIWDSISHIQLCAYITGEKDTKYVGIARRLNAIYPSRVAILPGLGHNCHFEDPYQFAKLLGDALRQW
ncbi:alpha/beta fold hydrolase [bacterium]|nr:alpha/beta fold hydrolase [bacterium]